MKPRTYIQDPNFHMTPEFLSDEVYGQVLTSLVIVCADTMLINRENKTVYLTTRRVKPMEGPWIIGGRIRAGDLPEQGMVRNFKRETSLEIDPSRLFFITMHRYMWSERNQEPQDKGSDTLAYTYGLETTDEERELISQNLNPDEYDIAKGLQEYDLARLKSDAVHPGLIDLYLDAFPETR